jgi:hypothetical protein
VPDLDKLASRGIQRAVRHALAEHLDAAVALAPVLGPALRLLPGERPVTEIAFQPESLSVQRGALLWSVCLLAAATPNMDSALAELRIRECRIPAKLRQPCSGPHLMNDPLKATAQADDHPVVLGDMPDMSGPAVNVLDLRNLVTGQDCSPS